VTIDEILRGVNIALGSAGLQDCAASDRDGNGEVTVDELLGAVNAALTGCPIEPIFPANYRDTFIEVRDCRFSIEHSGTYIRVLTDPGTAQPYRENANPLPMGAVVVKEEYSAADCRPSSLQRWRVMRKEQPGFDPVSGDWRWQWVDADRSVRFNDKATCIGCHIRPACVERDFMCTLGGPPRGELTYALRTLPAALLSITGTSSSNVYAVGADPDADDFGPYVIHYDGSRWYRLNTGANGDLWWISVDPIDGAYYMAGENGLVLRYDLETQQFSRLVTPGNALLFGIWGTSASNIYAVGGTDDEDAGGVLWRFDGISWTVIDLSSVLPDGVPTLYKVWGRTANEVYVVGRRGLILRFDGTDWSRMTTGSQRPLFTIHGNENAVIATGGFSDGVILELEGDRFFNRASPGTPQMNGIFVPQSGGAVAAGIAGSLALRTSEGWELPDTLLNTARDFHAVWVDPDGGVWAVGGDLSVDLSQGMVAYGGDKTIGTELVQLSLCPPPSPSSEAQTTVSFTRDIIPLFEAAGCQTAACHGGAFPSSAYDMRTYTGVFGPGVLARSLRACEVVPGNPDASFLIEKLIPRPRLGGIMPPLPRSALSLEQVQLVRTWILEGALFDGDIVATPTPTLRRTPTPTPIKTTGRTCAQLGSICTVVGTGRSLFDGDGKLGEETSLYYPLSVTFDSLQRPLIVDWNNLRLRRVNDNGRIETVMGTGDEAFPVDGALAVDTPLHHASEARFDPSGRLFIAGDHVPVVFRVDTDGRVYTVAGSEQVGYDGDGGPARGAKLTTPFGVLPTANGGLYIADIDAHVIRYVEPNGTIRTVAGTGQQGYSGDGGPATSARLAGPARMRLDAEGNLYFAEAKNHVIRRVGLDGRISTVAGQGQRGYLGDGGPARNARFDAPYDLELAPNGDLYVADTGNSVVRRIDRDGYITTVVGVGKAGFDGDRGDAKDCQLNRPSGLALADDGALWIADTFNNRVRRVQGMLLMYP
jgi:hypothetical protein